jgi:hypothetical protein
LVLERTKGEIAARGDKEGAARVRARNVIRLLRCLSRRLMAGGNVGRFHVPDLVKFEMFFDAGGKMP